MSILTFDQSFINRFFRFLKFPSKEKELIISFLRKFKNREDLYVVGGAVRAIFTGEEVYDLDITVKSDVESLTWYLKRYLGYHFVPLAPELGIYRLAKGRCSVDFTAFRGETIEEDLSKRDFTFNAMAIPINSLFKQKLLVIDPFGGYEDLKKGIIRIIAEKNIIEDPLRILRGYRFFALNLGILDEKTREYFKRYKQRIKLCARERILQELIYILKTNRGYQTFRIMDEDGVLEEIFPYIKACKGVPQPSFHHLDVWGHLLESLKWAEEILKEPKKYLALNDVPHKDEDFVISVKLASFFHDLGKAYTFKIRDRITFYGHERVSAELFKEMAEDLRFKKDIINKVYNLIKNHMRPFHLLNEKEKGSLSTKAKRNLIRDVLYLTELFIISMADSLASKGPDKEPDYEERLKEFFKELFDFKKELQKETTKKKLITGHDLIALGLKPGPIFKKILQEVELLVLEGKIKDKEEALEFVKNKYITCKN